MCMCVCVHVEEVCSGYVEEIGLARGFGFAIGESCDRWLITVLASNNDTGKEEGGGEGDGEAEEVSRFATGSKLDVKIRLVNRRRGRGGGRGSKLVVGL